MTGVKKDRLVEIDTDQNLFSGRGPFTAGELIGRSMDAVHHGIGDAELEFESVDV
jgi:hypothetical protein